MSEDAHWTDRFVGKPETRGDLSDCQIATDVRMLTRSDLDYEAVVCAARDRIARLSRQVRDTGQQLTAATAAREQAEAALCEMREVFGEVIDWQGIDHEDDDCPEDDTCECKLVAKVNAVFKSASGKSTADELARLRLLEMCFVNRLHLLERIKKGESDEAVSIRQILQYVAAQPERSERSDNASRSET